MAAEAPSNNNKIMDILQNIVAYKKDNSVLNIQDYKLIGLFFAAHWSPPDRIFVKKLVDFYRNWKDSGKNIEIIYLGCSVDQNQHYEFYEQMPWAYQPFNDPKVMELRGKYNVVGTPWLMIINDKGEIVTHKGTHDVYSKGVDAIEEWIK